MQIVDFDGESLRRTLPAIVKTLEGALSAGGRVRSSIQLGSAHTSASGQIALNLAALLTLVTTHRYRRMQMCANPDIGLMLRCMQCLQVYVHCTAGLGRAPAACIAWMYWFGDRQLDEVGCMHAHVRHRWSVLV